MGLGEIQNLYAKTLDAQNVYQQVVGQSELALRQSEQRGIVEARRKESMVAEESESASSEGLSGDMTKQATMQRMKRYRLNWFPGGQPEVELVNDYPQSRRLVDLKV